MAKFFAGNPLWNEIRRRARKSRTLTACVAYVGRHPLELMKWRPDDRLVVNVTEETVRRASCSARGALALLNRRVQVFQAPDLHAKAYLFDNSAIVCSANVSSNSQDDLEEAGVVITGIGLKPVRRWVRSLLSRDSTTRLDSHVLKALARMEPKTPGSGRSRQRKLRGQKREHWLVRTGRLWVLSTSTDEGETSAEASAARKAASLLVKEGVADEPSDIEWMKACGGRTYKLARAGDGIVHGWEPSARAPFGKFSGPVRCIARVDLGKKWGARRYRLALAAKGERTTALTANALRPLARPLRLRLGKGQFRGFGAVRELKAIKHRRAVARLLGIKAQR